MDWLHNICAFLASLDLGPVPGVGGDTKYLQSIINTILGVSGAIAVLVIVLAGFRYIFSQGSPNELTTARNAILYATIGLIVIIAAFAIVNFVVFGVGRVL
jgi:type IV secretory pathway VirB2 component (pilin)